MKVLHTYVTNQAAKTSLKLAKFRLGASAILALICALMIVDAKSTKDSLVAIGMTAGFAINAWVAWRTLELQKRQS